jgi:hypothetical protein
MTEYVVHIWLINSFLIKAETREQAKKLVLEHQDLGLDLSGDYDINVVTKEDFDRVDLGSPYQTLSAE